MSIVISQTELAQIDCGSCGGVYAITERHRTYCEHHSESWICPYCKTGWGFNHDGSPLDKARRELAAERARLDQTKAALGDARLERDHVEHQRRGEKAAKTRLKKRIAGGVCPCCNRSFPGDKLALHIKSKHPDFGGGEG